MRKHIYAPNVLYRYLVTTKGKREHMKSFGKQQLDYWFLSLMK